MRSGRLSGKMRFAFAAVALVLALGGGLVLTAYAAPDSSGFANGTEMQAQNVAKSGTWYTCPWELSSDGTLTVHPGQGMQVVKIIDGWLEEIVCPWEMYSADITKIVFTVENGKKAVAPQDCTNLFKGLENLSSIDLAGLDTSATTNMDEMFRDCTSLTTVDLHPLDLSKVESMSALFCNCTSLTTLDLSNLKTPALEDMRDMFSGCTSLVSLNVANLDVSSVRDMSDTFDRCESLKSLDLSTWKTASLSSMFYTFSRCYALTSINLAGFDTSNVTDMTGVFQFCKSLASVDVSSFDTSKAKRMGWMFQGCEAIVSLDLSNFDTSSATEMDQMFEYCEKLASVNLLSFETSKVEDMHEMFEDCEALTTLDLSSFDTVSATDMRSLFYGCSKLKTIFVSDSWSIAKATTGGYMFFECPSIVGGAGTAYDDSYSNWTFDDSKYAHVDGVGGPGYLTYKKGAAPAGLAFASSEMSRELGDGAFTNALTKATSAKVEYSSSDEEVASVDAAGLVTPHKTGTVTIKARAPYIAGYRAGSASFELEVIHEKHVWGEWKVVKKPTVSAKGLRERTCQLCDEAQSEQIAKLSSSDDKGSSDDKAASDQQTAKKLANPLKVKAKSKVLRVSFSNLAKKKVTIAKAKAFKVTDAKGKLTFKKVSGDKKLTVSKTGKVTVEKGIKKGTYKLKVKVTAAGDSVYKSAGKTVTLTVKVQ